MLKLGIMQPYFFPYIGYWQMMNYVDKYVIYDNIQYTKSGWYRRNRIKINNEAKMFSLPIKKDSDYLDVRDRRLADGYALDNKKILNQIKSAYHKAPYFSEVYPIVEDCFLYDDSNLFDFIFYSVNQVRSYIGIDTPIIVSSTLNIDHQEKGKNKVIEICEALHADTYINPIGGIELYNVEEFQDKGIDLHFIKADDEISYSQGEGNFIPSLSIIDVMMYNDKIKIQELLTKFSIE
jgi:hypothetical protein